LAPSESAYAINVWRVQYEEEIESALQTAAEAVAEVGLRGFEPLVLIARARLARLLGDEGRYRG